MFHFHGEHSIYLALIWRTLLINIGLLLVNSFPGKRIAVATAFFRMIALEKTSLSTTELVKRGLAIDINGFKLKVPSNSLFEGTLSIK